MTGGVQRGASHWLVLAPAAAVLLVVKVAIRLYPVWTIRLAASRRRRSADDGTAVVARLTHTVESLGSNALFRNDCLSRSVTVLFLARWAGVYPRLVIGARRVGQDLDAHAWLECAGVPVPRQDVGHYARLWAPR